MDIKVKNISFNAVNAKQKELMSKWVTVVSG